MSWFPWPESIKKRACRYLLQHYLGQFLQEKLDLEQMSVDLYDGKGSVSKVLLDIYTINETLEQFQIPFEVLEGRIDCVSATIPWSNLLNDHCSLEISGLQVTVQPKCYTTATSNLSDSFYMSLQNMTTSMELAQQCFKDHQANEEKLFEGLELFAQMLETVVSKVNVSLVNTRIRLEHVPENSKYGFAIRLDLEHLKYFDEAGAVSKSSSDNAEGTNANLSFGVASKCLVILNCSAHLEIFDATMPATVTDPDVDKHTGGNQGLQSAKFASLLGEQQIKVRMKKLQSQNEPKFDVECFFDNCSIYLCPVEIPFLFDCIKAWTSPLSVNMAKSDYDSYKRVQLQMDNNPALYQNTNIPGCYSPSEERFDSVDVMADQFHSMTCSNDANMSDFFVSVVDKDNFEPEKPKIRDKSRPLAPDSIDFNGEIRIKSLLIHVLHENPPLQSTEPIEITSNCQAFLQHISEISKMAEKHFDVIKQSSGKHSLVYRTKNPKVLSEACATSHHIRFIGGPLFLHAKSSLNAMFKTTESNITIGRLEILECLYSNANPDNWTHSKILNFVGSDSQGSTEPCVINVVETEYPDTTESLVKCKLPETHCEIDLSIIERVYSLVQCFSNQESPNFVNSESFSDTHYPEAKSRQIIFQHVLMEEAQESNKLYNVDVTTDLLKVTLFFPIPDLRLHDKDYNLFVQKLRPDKLYLIATKVDVSTAFSSEGSPNLAPDAHSAKEFGCAMEQMKILYSQSNSQPPISIIKVSKTTSSDESKNPHIHVKLSSKKKDTLSEFYSVPEKRNSDSLNEKYLGFTGDDFQSQNSWNNALPDPFSQRKVIYNNSEVKAPGNSEELSNFVTHAQATASLFINLNLPLVYIHLPSKEVFENLYNRLANDLLLWEPATQDTSGKYIGEGRSNSLAVQSQFLPFLSKSNETLTEASESDEEESSEFSVQPDNKKQSQDKTYITVTLEVGSGVISVICTPTQELGPCPKSHLMLEIKDGVLCVASQYCGNPNLDYISFDVEELTLRQKIDPNQHITLDNVADESFRSTLATLIHHSNDCRGNESNMLTLAMRLESEQNPAFKQYLVSCLLSGTTLNHMFVQAGQSWLELLLDFFDLFDEPILGYEPPAVITELHLHIQDCSIQYTTRNLQPPLSSVVYLQSLSLSSNIVAGSPHYVLQIVVDNASLYLTDRTLPRNYQLSELVKVLDLNILEINLKMANPKTGSGAVEESTYPLQQEFDLSISNNEIHLMTCSDSCAAIGRLISYLAQEGDFNEFPLTKAEPSISASSENLQDSLMSSQGNNTMDASCHSVYDDALSDMMLDAMQDVDEPPNPPPARSGRKHKQDASRKMTMSTMFLMSHKMPSSDDEFCIVVDPDLESTSEQSDQPEVEYLVTTDEIKVCSNHFRPVFGKIDQLDAPAHFPKAIQKLTIKEMTCKWSIFGGLDFSSGAKVVPTSSPTSSPYMKKQQEGSRDSSCLLEVYLNKIRFRHETYHPMENTSARSILIIPDFEVRDRLENSHINKLLHGFHSESSPKQSHANMLLIKSLLSKGDEESSECRLWVSLQPIKLNVDQDTLDFLSAFFESLTNSSKEEMDVGGSNEHHNADAASMEQSRLSSTGTIQFKDHNANASQQIYFKEFIFSPDAPIRLDYQGKHVHMDQGTIAGLLKGLAQLNCSQLKLRKIVHRHGLLGVDRLVQFCLNEWANDILKHQIPSILGGVGPLHSFVQFSQGFYDLVRLPVEQYRRDGRIIKGLQMGTTAFGTSTSTAALELANRVVCLVQSAAETTFSIVSPASLRRQRQQQLSLRSFGQQAKRRRQPTDAREGINNAFDVVCDGVTETAVSLARVAQQEHEENGLAGAVGGVLRQIPPTLIKPVIIATKATSNVLSGIRNQIQPDAKREDDLKWRSIRK